jgi:hypothetical protein
MFCFIHDNIIHSLLFYPIIAGSYSGIGEANATLLAESGAKFVLTGLEEDVHSRKSVPKCLTI